MRQALTGLRRDQFYIRNYAKFLAGVLILWIAACSRTTPVKTATPVATIVPAETQVDATVTLPSTATSSPTVVPLAANVNGYEITLAQYQSELAFYRAALGRELTPEDETRVLDDLVVQALLAQAASLQGFSVEDSLLQERRQYLVDQLGSEGALSNWMGQYQYDELSFRQALARAIGAAWMRDQILAAVPSTAEQVHAIQILLYDSGEADEVLAQLQAGNSFANLAVRYDPLTGGDLGWFPRGYLPDPQLEEAAFNLAPGAFSPVIETLAGYHILQVLERDPQRVLSPEAHLALQAQALEIWLGTERSNSDIQILLP